MKQTIFFLFVFVAVSCSQNQQQDNLLGTWNIVSSTDIETGEVDLPEEKLLVNFKSDSLYLNEDLGSGKVFAWKIKGDSIFL